MEGAEVAVKCVFVCQETEKLFLRELQGLSAVRHPNIVSLLGELLFPMSFLGVFCDDPFDGDL